MRVKLTMTGTFEIPDDHPEWRESYLKGSEVAFEDALEQLRECTDVDITCVEIPGATAVFTVLEMLSGIVRGHAIREGRSERSVFSSLAKDAFERIPSNVEIRALCDRFSASAVRDAVRELNTRYGGSSKGTAR
jgi:hypothetical protein